MSEEEDDFDGEKTQIWLPGGDKPGPAAADPAGDREGIQLKPRADEKPAAAARPAVDIDITSGAGLDGGAAASGSPAPTAPKPPGAGRPPARRSSFGPLAIVALAVAAAIAGYLLLR